jgi:hypothetical protein
VTPQKAKESDKESEKEEAEEKVAEPEPAVVEEKEAEQVEPAPVEEEDELIIKDDIDNDCFEEVDRIGDVEKLVRVG